MTEWPLQTGLYTKLCADAALTALLPAGEDSIFDHVPASSVFPYIVMGDMQSQPQATAAYEGTETKVTISGYSRNPGAREIRHVMQAIRNCLHQQDFIVPGHALVLCEEISSQSTLGNDGVTRMSSQVFRIITEPV